MPAPAVMTMTSAFLMIYFTHEIASCAIPNLSVSMSPPIVLNTYRYYNHQSRHFFVYFATSNNFSKTLTIAKVSSLQYSKSACLYASRCVSFILAIAAYACIASPP